MTHPVRRGFADVGGGRQMHYRARGDGPAALFVHSSPTNSEFMLGDMAAQADRFCCVAFDTPGFGLSDPLPGEALEIADLADALADGMAALGMPPAPVYGTHTGAAIALSLAVRHPAKVTTLVLDGVPLFTREEAESFADDRHFAPLVVDPLGGHYASSWTRFRDQSIWFPWYARSHDKLNEYDLIPPESIHRWVAMFFAAAPHYKPAYRAAIFSGEATLAAAQAVTTPVCYTATTTDMLHPHMARLPASKPGQAIVEIGTSLAAKHALTGERFAADETRPRFTPPAVAIGSSAVVHRQFVGDGDRQQLIRFVGDRTRPVRLLLHDAPGSGAMVEDRMGALAHEHFVIAPDLPGSGESDPLEATAGLEHYAAALWRLCDALDLPTIEIEAHGLGASLAVAMAAAAPARCRGIQLDGLLMPDAAERSELLELYAPPIAIERDGAHWYRTWLMLRDAQIYWPWYSPTRAALRRTPADFGAQTLHERTIETMKQHASYHRILRAAIRYDAAAALAGTGVPVERLPSRAAVFDHVHGPRLDTLLAGRRIGAAA